MSDPVPGGAVRVPGGLLRVEAVARGVLGVGGCCWG